MSQNKQPPPRQQKKRRDAAKPLPLKSDAYATST
jgi:hypothetical protein